MAKVIGVQFQKNGKVYYFEPGPFTPKAGDYVIVETDRGADLAEVVLDAFEFEPGQNDPALKKISRMATEADLRCAMENRAKEKEAFSVCQKKIQEHQLEMKLVSAEYAFDGSKVLFYFTANGRVDFRSLVKDLASVFKTRIELRQIGVRDEARMLGGLGPCGRPICCKAFLNDFQPVSIKMAKEQNLSLNPTKISGVCGRLMCCLKYEQDQYEAVRKKMPRMGREIATPDGPGTVTDLNIVKETVSVRIPNGDTHEIKTYTLEEIIAAREERKNQETGRKNAEETERTESTEELTAEPGTPEADAVEEAAGTAEAPAAELQPRTRPPKNRGAGKAEADKNETPERKLGQPVKRENTKKARPEGQAEKDRDRKKQERPAEESGGRGRPERQNREPEERKTAPAEAPVKQERPKKTSWSDQLQKAMAAIEHESADGKE